MEVLLEKQQAGFGDNFDKYLFDKLFRIALPTESFLSSNTIVATNNNNSSKIPDTNTNINSDNQNDFSSPSGCIWTDEGSVFDDFLSDYTRTNEALRMLCNELNVVPPFDDAKEWDIFITCLNASTTVPQPVPTQNRLYFFVIDAIVDINGEDYMNINLIKIFSFCRSRRQKVIT